VYPAGPLPIIATSYVISGKFVLLCYVWMSQGKRMILAGRGESWGRSQDAGIGGTVPFSAADRVTFVS
jgi:hypothetical protein